MAILNKNVLFLFSFLKWIYQTTIYNTVDISDIAVIMTDA